MLGLDSLLYSVLIQSVERATLEMRISSIVAGTLPLNERLPPDELPPISNGPVRPGGVVVELTEFTSVPFR
jgi:hypothetical protein